MKSSKKIITITIILAFIIYSLLGLVINNSYAENESLDSDTTINESENNTGDEELDEPTDESENNETDKGESVPAIPEPDEENNKETEKVDKPKENVVTNVVSKSSNAKLSNLGIRPNDFTGFRSDITTYDVTVPEDVEEVEVYAQKQDSKATVEGTGNKKLEKGKNEILVTVTAEDGTQKTYTLNVTREEAEDLDGIPDGLSELKIDNVTLTPKFKTDVYEYTVKYIGEETKIDIKTTATDPYYTVEITGNEELKEGENLITILVSDPDGKNVATYQITVNKSLVDEEILASEQEEARRKDEQKKMMIIGVVIAVAVLAIVIFLVIRNRRNRAFAEEYTVPFAGLNDDGFEDEYQEGYEEELDYQRKQPSENNNYDEDTELSKEEIKKKYLDNYNSYDYENEEIDEAPKRGRHKGKRFK